MEKLFGERTRIKTLPGLQWGDVVHVDGEMVQLSSIAARLGLTPWGDISKERQESSWGFCSAGWEGAHRCARYLPISKLNLCCRSVTQLPPGTEFVFADKIIRGLIVKGEEKCRLVIP